VENQGQSLRMAYMDIQPKKSNGQTVLLLHGKNFNGRYWQVSMNSPYPKKLAN
jgi:pimeloyl-ACP methyl ester carboxylesterase